MKSIIFDFDGTLANTQGCIVQSMEYALEKMGCEAVPPEAVCALIGLPLSEMMIRLGGLTDADAIQEAMELYRIHFDEIFLSTISLFPHVKEVLQELQERNFLLAVATSRNRASLQNIMQALNIDSYFTVTMCDEDVKEKKPAAEMVLKLMEKLHVDANDTIVVGDTVFDIEMGHKAGCRTVGVAYGNQSYEQLMQSEAMAVLTDIRQLLSLL